MEHPRGGRGSYAAALQSGIENTTRREATRDVTGSLWRALLALRVVLVVFMLVVTAVQWSKFHDPVLAGRSGAWSSRPPRVWRYGDGCRAPWLVPLAVVLGLTPIG